MDCPPPETAYVNHRIKLCLSNYISLIPEPASESKFSFPKFTERHSSFYNFCHIAKFSNFYIMQPDGVNLTHFKLSLFGLIGFIV